MRNTRLLPLIVALLAGCSAEIQVGELTGNEEAGAPIDGVPFRVKERMLVRVVQKSANGYEQIHEQLETLPNPYRLYVLRYRGGPLANATTQFTLEPDGTLTKVSVKSTSQGEQALTALGTQIESIAGRVAALDTARETERRAEEDAIVAYQEALNAARDAEAELLSLPSTAAAVDRIKKENEFELLKLKANIAARRAGIREPFPASL
jgi:hypothetical protein